MINVLTIISAESSFYLPVDSLSLTRHCDEGEHDGDDGLLHFLFFLEDNLFKQFINHTSGRFNFFLNDIALAVN